MTFPHTLALSQALSALGIKGGQIPAIGGSLLPVVVMGDFSRSYTAEPFESRGFAGSRTTYPNGTRMLFSIFSRGRGGIVVEDVRLSNTAALGGAQLAFVDLLDAAPAGAVNQLVVVSTGNPSIPPSSFIFQGDTLAAPSGAGPVDFSGLLVGTQPLGYAARFHVPPGKHLVFIGENTNGGQLQTALSFREIPEPIGAP